MDIKTIPLAEVLGYIKYRLGATVAKRKTSACSSQGIRKQAIKKC